LHLANHLGVDSAAIPRFARPFPPESIFFKAKTETSSKPSTTLYLLTSTHHTSCPFHSKLHFQTALVAVFRLVEIGESLHPNQLLMRR
jgi:hypothetical protein